MNENIEDKNSSLQAHVRISYIQISLFEGSL